MARCHSYFKTQSLLIWSILFLSTIVASSHHKSNQKICSQEIKKWYPYLRYCHIALRKYLHCFLKMLSIFSTTFRLKSNSKFHWTIKHPQKSNSRWKSIKFSSRMKSIFIVWCCFFIRPKNLIPFPKTTIFQINSQSLRLNPIKQEHLIWIFKIKNKKKGSKDKFQVFRKKSSSPTGFKKNLHPNRFKTYLVPD